MRKPHVGGPGGAKEWRVAGSVKVPRRLTVHDINHGLILATEKDEWDIPHIRVFAVEGLAP